MRSFKNLMVWQRSMDLVDKIYEVTRELPDAEKYTLASQIRRAVVSIPSNIAEGCGRETDKEMCHYLDIACGSLNEVETQFLIINKCYPVKNILRSDCVALIESLGKMIYCYKRQLAPHSSLPTPEHA